MAKTSGKLVYRFRNGCFCIVPGLSRAIPLFVLCALFSLFIMTKNVSAQETRIDPASLQDTANQIAITCTPPCMTCGIAENTVKNYTEARRNAHQSWVMANIFPLVVDDLQAMTEELSQNGLAVMNNIGRIADAAQQQRAQRRLQKIKYESALRNKPNPKMCGVATMSNGLGAAKDNGKIFSANLASYNSARFNGQPGSVAETGIDADKRARWNTFVTKFCDPYSENGAMEKVCQNNDPAVINKDIDFAGTVALSDTIKESDQDAVMMLSSYLYGHNLPRYRFTQDQLDPEKHPDNFNINERMKRVYAIRSLALQSFNSYVATKAEGPPEDGDDRSRRMGVLQSLGYPPEVVAQSIDHSPSYTERMNLMQDALFNNPSFHIDNLTTEEHIQQNILAMRILDNMQLRSILESQQRMEMLNAAWLELDLRNEQNKLESTMSRGNLQEGRR